MTSENFKQGVEAFKNGLLLTDNPYTPELHYSAWDNWSNGWTEAKIELAKWQNEVKEEMKAIDIEGAKNTPEIRKKISDLLVSIAKKKVTEYEVVCDEQNNPPSDVDQNSLRVDIFLHGMFAQNAREKFAAAEMDEPDPTAIYMSTDDVYNFANEMHTEALKLKDELHYGGFNLDPIHKRIEFCEAVMEMSYRMKELDK